MEFNDVIDMLIVLLLKLFVRECVFDDDDDDGIVVDTGFVLTLDMVEELVVGATVDDSVGINPNFMSSN